MGIGQGFEEKKLHFSNANRDAQVQNLERAETQNSLSQILQESEVKIFFFVFLISLALDYVPR